MKTYLADIIPKIQRFSRRLDDLTKLTNQHWVSLTDMEDVKRVFMFRNDNRLLIIENGTVTERGTWEYLGNQSILIEISGGGYLLKHGFFDEYVIALKRDGSDGYVFFVNETKYENELNNIGDVLQFLEDKYLKRESNQNPSSVGSRPQAGSLPKGMSTTYRTKNGMLTLTSEYVTLDKKIIYATLDGRPAPDGKYRLGFMWYITVRNGIVIL